MLEKLKGLALRYEDLQAQLADPDVALPGGQVIQHCVLYADNIHQGEIVSVFVCLQCLR